MRLWEPRDNNYIPASERWPVKKLNEVKIDHSRRDRDLLIGIAALVILVPLALLVHMFVEPHKAKAEEYTPKQDYPLTNRGSCERIGDTGMKVQGAGTEEVRNLCEKNGITL